MNQVFRFICNEVYPKFFQIINVSYLGKSYCSVLPSNSNSNQLIENMQLLMEYNGQMFAVFLLLATEFSNLNFPISDWQ